ncbi:MAG: DUF1614 domain-containing protein [Scytonema hyalinum WJT4-NPBG1]|nr:DUF1614 domain-containing protein [Scytonema hyalinum WJT4-NPBG1]
MLLLLPFWFVVAVDVLIGSDLLHLQDLQGMTRVLTIGGVRVFDGIALCGLFALLLT